MAARAAARGMASRARAGPPALSPAAYAASLEVEHYASMPLLDLNLTNRGLLVRPSAKETPGVSWTRRGDLRFSQESSVNVEEASMFRRS